MCALPEESMDKLPRQKFAVLASEPLQHDAFAHGSENESAKRKIMSSAKDGKQERSLK